MCSFKEDIVNNLQILGFENLLQLPKLKEVKKAYFQKSKELHPDKHMSDNETTKKEYEEKFKVLLSAYRIVSLFIIKNGEVKEEDKEETLIRK